MTIDPQEVLGRLPTAPGATRPDGLPEPALQSRPPVTPPIACYWCVVALDYDKEHAWIVAASDDALNNDLLAGGTEASDNGIDPAWITDAVPGLYRLTLNPW